MKGPSKVYCKGDFKGLIWLEFADAADRDAAIQYIKESGTLLGTNRVWANLEKPVEERVPLTVLLRAKDLLVKWGEPKELIWVDPDTKSLSYNKKVAISAAVVDLELKVDFEDGWAEWVRGEAWDTLLKDATAGLDKKRAYHMKGKGKGKDLQMKGTGGTS